jgi:hypothetical protein
MFAAIQYVRSHVLYNNARDALTGKTITFGKTPAGPGCGTLPRELPEAQRSPSQSPAAFAVSREWQPARYGFQIPERVLGKSALFFQKFFAFLKQTHFFRCYK